MTNLQGSTDSGRDHHPTRAVVRWVARTILGSIVLGAAMLLLAGHRGWTMGWVYVISLPLVGLASAFVVDPSLLAERNVRRHRDQRAWDGILFGLYGTLAGFVLPLLAALTVRLDWRPQVASPVQFLALVVYSLGWALHLWAMVANKYFSQVIRIQTNRGQTVIQTGPYRYVRRPGYAGGILFTAATPLMLGSLWAFGLGAIAAFLLAVRTILEDKVLQQELAGYAECAQHVRFRLVPYLW